MPYPGWEPQSEYPKAILRGLAEGKAIGMAEGLAEGMAEGLRLLLRARNIAPTAEQQERMNACSDPAQLEVWIRRAAVISDVDQLFAMT